MAPRKRRAVFDGVLLVSFGFLERHGVLFLEPYPFDLLLKETEGAAAAGPPGVILRQAEARPIEDFQHTRLVDSGFLEGQLDDEAIVLRRIAFAILFVTANRNIAVDGGAGREDRPKPSLERSEFELSRAPARLRRRKESRCTA